MTTWAIGDIQGCHDELRALVAQLGFRADRDQLWFTGDLVNRGPRSLETLRYVRSLGDNAITVLGNHDLHLLAVAFATKRKIKSADTIEDVLEPFLIQQGYLQRTPRGRVATVSAYRHLGLAAPKTTDSGALFGQ